VNAEHYLVHHHPPTVNGRVDYVYLSKLSPGGYDGWLISYRWAKDTIQRYAGIPPASLGEDDLRQLSYAGAIIGTVTRSYLRLTDIYAGSGDKKVIADALRNTYLTHMTKYRADVSYDLSRLEKNASASGRLDRVVDYTQSAVGKKETLTNQMDKIDSRITFLTGTVRHQLPVSVFTDSVLHMHSGFRILHITPARMTGYPVQSPGACPNTIHFLRFPKPNRQLLTGFTGGTRLLQVFTEHLSGTFRSQNF